MKTFKCMIQLTAHLILAWHVNGVSASVRSDLVGLEETVESIQTMVDEDRPRLDDDDDDENADSQNGNVRSQKMGFDVASIGSDESVWNSHPA